MTARMPLALVLTLALAACHDPHSAFPSAPPPNRSCQIGSPAGYDVWVWDCVDNRHVVVSQFCGELVCSGADRETSACGEPTAFETEHLRELDRCGASARAW